MQVLTAMAPSGTTVLAVDTACQVPMQTVKCSTSKAYIFRSATEKPRKERMDSMPYSDSGQIGKIAPYAPQDEKAAAGAEDHPDAQGMRHQLIIITKYDTIVNMHNDGMIVANIIEILIRRKSVHTEFL